MVNFELTTEPLARGQAECQSKILSQEGQPVMLWWGGDASVSRVHVPRGAAGTDQFSPYVSRNALTLFLMQTPPVLHTDKTPPSQKKKKGKHSESFVTTTFRRLTRWVQTPQVCNHELRAQTAALGSGERLLERFLLSSPQQGL